MILYVKAENVKLLKRTIREKNFPCFFSLLIFSVAKLFKPII